MENKWNNYPNSKPFDDGYFLVQLGMDIPMQYVARYDAKLDKWFDPDTNSKEPEEEKKLIYNVVLWTTLMPTFIGEITI